MNLVLEGYDEYVKDFEEVRRNADVLPKAEEEIKERVEERISGCGVDHFEYLMYTLKKENTCTGKDIVFMFDTKPDEEGVNFCIRYRMCG